MTGAVELPEATEMVMPGDNIKMKVELISPIAMEEGLRFAIREGGRTVGAGVVAKIINNELIQEKIMANQNIRIRLKAFDHRLIDKSARESSRRPSAPARPSRVPCRCRRRSSAIRS